MINERYPEETLDRDDDDGTMPDNVATLAESVVGHKIVSCTQTKTVKPIAAGLNYLTKGAVFEIELDNGTRVTLADTWDCCAYTELYEFLLHPDRVDHVIMGVGTTDEYTTWHIYCDLGDILELTVGWCCGNPFYYGYGFEIKVSPIDETAE